ncbi:unnamed protein product [Caenorhabditis brenneri]
MAVTEITQVMAKKLRKCSTRMCNKSRRLINQLTDRKLRSQDKVETRARQQSSGAGRNSQKKKEDFKKPATPVNTSSSDSSPSPILQRSKKALPKNQARKVLSQSQMFDKPSPRSRDYHSESEINDVPRRAGQPLSLSMDVTQSTEKENEKSLHVDSGNKKTENSVISSSTPYPSFFVVKKEVAMDLQTVLRAFCLFHRSIVKKQEKHALNELVSSTMDHWLTMVPIKKITRIMDHVLIEIFEVSETPISNHRSENVDLKVLLASFTSLAQEFGLKMDSRAMEDWNVLKKTYDDKPTFVSVSELDQLLTFHLCRRF